MKQTGRGKMRPRPSLLGLIRLYICMYCKIRQLLRGIITVDRHESLSHQKLKDTDEFLKEAHT